MPRTIFDSGKEEPKIVGIQSCSKCHNLCETRRKKGQYLIMEVSKDKIQRQTFKMTTAKVYEYTDRGAAKTAHTRSYYK